MKMDIPGVLYRFAERSITEQEETDFAAYLQSLSPGEFSELMDIYGKIVRESPYKGVPDKPLLSLIEQRIEQRIDLVEQLADGAGRRGMIRKIYWTVSAAAACLLLIGGIHMLTRSNQPVRTANTALVLRIAPGGDKAVLTLADGRKITLDSAQNGALARQGSVRILKLQGGRLAYNDQGNAAGRPSGPILYNTITTPRGGQYAVVLPDGSKVWLNAASSLRFPASFDGQEREVGLTGEGYFEIAQNSRQPFVVRTRGEEIHVLGTRFNIMAYDDEDAVRTTLVTGTVKVVSGVNSQVVKPGEQVSVGNGNKALITSIPDMKSVLAWQQGHFRFDGFRITAIMRQIQRWYDVEVEYRGPIPTDEFNGDLSRDEYASQILKALERTGNVHFDIEGNKIIVMTGTK
jgi:transmembrane sensor